VTCGFGADGIVFAVEEDHVVVVLLFTGVEDGLTFVVALDVDGVGVFAV